MNQPKNIVLKTPRGLAFAALIAMLVLTIGAIQAPKRSQRRAPPGAPPTLQQPDEQVALHKLYDAELRANMAFDVDALANLWTEDIVAIPPGQAPLIGKAAYRQLLEAERDQAKDADLLDYSQDWKEIQVNGEYAYEWGTISKSLKPKSGEEQHYKWNAMRVLKKQATGNWEIHRVIWNDAGAAAAKAAAPKQ